MKSISKSKPLPTLSQLEEAAFKADVKSTCDMIRENFSLKEHITISFVPLVLTQIALHYADKVRRYAADNRISVLRKLGRAYDALKDEYITRVKRDLDSAHLEHINNQAMRFMNEYAIHFQIMWFSANSELKKHYPSQAYEEMRTDAICGMLMIDLIFEYARMVDAMLENRLGKKMSKQVREPAMESLRLILDAYAGETSKLEFKDPNMQLSKKVILRKVQEIEFELVND